MHTKYQNELLLVGLGLRQIAQQAIAHSDTDLK